MKEISMSDKKPSNPLEEQTLQQTPDELSAAVALSTALDTDQDVSAPDIPGYTLKGELGQGAYGQVWRGLQQRTRKEVAVKVFLQRGGLDWLFLQREVERLTKLDRHPHIVTLLDTDLESDPPFYTMDLIEGGSLDAFVDTEQSIPQTRVLRWMKQIAEALVYVHGKGLIHCDLKPANILVDEQENVRVVDFGQSRVFTESSASLGTLYYMAPEQANLTEPGNPVHPDVRWDVYALGATIYAILTGQPPRATDASNETLQKTENLPDRLNAYRELMHRETLDPPPASRTPIHPELWAILTKCLAPNPDQRYESVSELLNDLDAFEQCRPVTPLASKRTYRMRKFVQRNPVKIVLGIAIAVAMISFAARKIDHDRAQGNAIIARFFGNPREAASDAINADGMVQSSLKDQCELYLSSPAWPQRMMGARAALIVSPDAFWNSVDGGPLWRYGEWLEVLSVDWSEQVDILDRLAQRAKTGTDRQKYVAFCLIGQLTGLGGSLEGKGSHLLDLCKNAINTESAPGVVSAARYTAMRMGKELPFPNHDPFLVDDVTGLTFVRIPEMNHFRRGSDPSDPDRFSDENRPENGVHVGGVYIATTEATLDTISEFLNSQACDELLDQRARKILRERDKSMTIEAKSRAAASLFNHPVAIRYCEWLDQKANNGAPKKHYRLPSEDEWEFAARGGNLDGRYCFGDNPVYAPYFAHCNGSEASVHEVARRMPNWYGLFDMHGGLWEWCDTKHDIITNQYIIRGGALNSAAVRCRSAQRNYISPENRLLQLGFRIVMEIDTK